MKKLYVYADFDWLPYQPIPMGELAYESLRGSDSHSSQFDNGWLAGYGGIFLSDDLNNYPGQQFTQPGKDIFGCFSDALPERWGRMLLHRRPAPHPRPRALSLLPGLRLPPQHTIRSSL